MKALLIFKDQDFPKVHDLSTLNDLCGSAGILIGIDDILLEILSGYAVRTRYPGDEPNLEEAREAIAIAKTIRRFARRFLGLEK